MHMLRNNFRGIAIVFAAVVIALAASSFGTPRETEASFTDVEGVICGFLHDLTLNGNPITFEGTVLVRIDQDWAKVTDDIAITAVAYTTGNATKSMPDCKTPQASFPVSVVPPDTQLEVRPSVIAQFDGDKTISGTSCQEDFVFAGFPLNKWTRISVTLSISQNPGVDQFQGSFNFVNEFDSALTCAVGSPSGGLGDIDVLFDSLYYSGAPVGTAVDSTDWDKDGCDDWTELNPAGFASHSDPFLDDCSAGVVGGVAEIVDVDAAPLEAAESAGSSSWLIAIVASAAVVGAMTLGGAFAYARRRSSR